MPETKNKLPLVVQVGFAGSRTLIDSAEHPSLDPATAEAEIGRQLAVRLQALREQMGPGYFLCGISQVAIGADTAFAHALKALTIPQRIFLPQPLAEYLVARSSSGRPDFSASEGERAAALAADSNVIETRVVSVAPERASRFEEVNLEIVRVSDVLVCLVGERVDPRAGGTAHAIAVAKDRGLPTLELRVRVVEDRVVLEEPPLDRDHLALPILPAPLAGSGGPPLPLSSSGVPVFQDYASTVKAHSSDQANGTRRFFGSAAFVVISAHLIATILAAGALAFHGTRALPWLLAVELLFLGCGFGFHQYLHHSRASYAWAITRAASEIVRSVSAAAAVHVYLDFLFVLPYPRSLRPLMRTLNVLHLAASRGSAGKGWEAAREAYLTRRVDHQLGYFKQETAKARLQVALTNSTFLLSSVLALVATTIKLMMVGGVFGVTSEPIESMEGLLGMAAVALPVVAAGALSLAASMDREARAHTFAEMGEFLNAQASLIKKARSSREFERLLLETEGHLLGENANWFARRSFTGVT